MLENFYILFVSKNCLIEIRLLLGKIISYSIPNEHYKNIGDGHTDSYMTYRNEDYDKLYISFLIGDGTDCTDEVSIKNHYKKIYKQMSNIKFESKCNK